MKRRVKPPNVSTKPFAEQADGDTAVGVLEVTPLNLDTKKEDDENAIHGFYQELLDTVSYPLHIYSRQKPTDLESYTGQLERETEFPRLRNSYIDFCRSVSNDGIIDTRHYVLVYSSGTAKQDAATVLSHRLEEVKSLLVGGELEVSHLTGKTLHEFLKAEWNSVPLSSPEMCVEKTGNNEEYRKMLYVDEYPFELSLGWTVRLLRVDGLVDVTQVVQPVSIEHAVKKLRRRSKKLGAEIDVAVANGQGRRNKLERLRDDVDWFLDVVADQECRPVKYGVYITAHGETRQQTRETFDRLKSRLRTLRIEFEEPGFRNDQGYKTDSVFYGDSLDETLLVPSSSAASGFPFGTQPFEVRSGVLYGINTGDGSPILLDRFNWDSHSMAVMGTLGSGKSYAAKLELLRSAVAYPDLRIVVVDPKKEYRSVVEALGGDHRLIKPGKEYSFDANILGFEVEERGEFENTSALVDLVSQVYSAVSKNRERTLVLIDEARNILEDDLGRRVLNRFVLEARDINTAVHLVTQSASHFTHWREGQEILDHVPGKMLFRHESVPESVVDSLDLSDQEQWNLLRLRSGEKAGYSEALLKVSGVVDTKIRVESSSFEHDVIESREHRNNRLLEGEH